MPIGVLLTLLLFALGQHGVIAKRLTECAAAQLDCLNGGWVDEAYCLSSVNPLQCQSIAFTRCSCPIAFEGSNCQIPTSTASCPTGFQFDNNPATMRGAQTFECYIDQDVAVSSRRWFQRRGTPSLGDELIQLMDHSVHMTADWSKGRMEFSILSRLQTTNRFRRALDCVLGESNYGPVVEIASCAASACRIEGLRATCAEFRCGPGHRRFPALRAALLSRTSLELDLSADSIQIRDLFELTSCSIGSCFPKDEIDRGLLSGFVLAPAFAVVLLLALVVIVATMHREVFHPPAAIVTLTRQKAAVSKTGSDGIDRRPISLLAPIGLAWRDLCYTLPAYGSVISSRKQPGETILRGSTGIVHPGEMVAIIGPSGAGKSTLLDILGGLRKPGTFSGEVSLTGAQRYSYPKSHLLSYVVQADHFLGAMTVWETLQFSAVTRLPRDTPASAILERVVESLKLVGLAHVATSVVGTPETGGISGGERRRLAVGVEVIAEPRVLLLDEITSGLDSFYATAVLNVLRQIATKTGVAILLTIHQPPAATFSLFDRLILMSTGGRTVFQGSPSAALSFVQETHLIPSPFLEGGNPFDYLISALNGRSIESAIESYRRSGQYGALLNEVDSATERSDEGRTRSRSRRRSSSLSLPPSRRRLSFLQQTQVLTMRSFRVIARDPGLLILYNVVTVAIALFAGFTFWKVDFGVSGVQNRVGYAFCSVLIGSLLSMTSVDLFVTERILFERETRAGSYAVLPYFISKLAMDLIPFRLLPALLFSCLTYYMVGFQPDARHFLVFTAVLVLCNAVAGASIFAISTAFADIKSANLIGVTYFMFNIVFGGPFLSQALKTGSSALLSNLSYFYYAFEMMVSNEFVGLPLFLTISDLSGGNSLVGGGGVDMLGDSILKTLHWNPNRQIVNGAVLCGMLVGFHFFAFVMLKIAQRKTR